MPKKHELEAKLAALELDLSYSRIYAGDLERQLDSMRARALEAERARNLHREWEEVWRAVAHSNPQLEGQLRRDELIRWLALPWGENDPQFPVTQVVTDEEGNGLGTETRVNAELQRTWMEVVRYKSEPRGEEEEGGGDTPAPQERG